MLAKVTYPHRSRVAKATYLQSIGGYSGSSRPSRWPLEYTVGVYMADMSFDRLWNTTVQYIHDTGGSMNLPHLERLKECYQKIYDEYNKDALWNSALEDLRSGVLDADIFYYRRSTGTEIKVELSLEGRNGKHLVITRFDGVPLTGMSSDMLYDLLMGQMLPSGEEVSDRDTLAKNAEWGVSNQFVTDLYCYARECEFYYTSRKASAALEEAAADILYGAAEMAEQEEAATPTGDSKEAARLLYDSLDMSNEELSAAFTRLCRAAGLSSSDIMF